MNKKLENYGDPNPAMLTWHQEACQCARPCAIFYECDTIYDFLIDMSDVDKEWFRVKQQDPTKIGYRAWKEESYYNHFACFHWRKWGEKLERAVANNVPVHYWAKFLHEGQNQVISRQQEKCQAVIQHENDVKEMAARVVLSSSQQDNNAEEDRESKFQLALEEKAQEVPEYDENLPVQAQVRLYRDEEIEPISVVNARDRFFVKIDKREEQKILTLEPGREYDSAESRGDITKYLSSGFFEETQRSALARMASTKSLAANTQVSLQSYWEALVHQLYRANLVPADVFIDSKYYTFLKYLSLSTTRSLDLTAIDQLVDQGVPLSLFVDKKLQKYFNQFVEVRDTASENTYVRCATNSFPPYSRVYYGEVTLWDLWIDLSSFARNFFFGTYCRRFDLSMTLFNRPDLLLEKVFLKKDLAIGLKVFALRSRWKDEIREHCWMGGTRGRLCQGHCKCYRIIEGIDKSFQGYQRLIKYEDIKNPRIISAIEKDLIDWVHAYKCLTKLGIVSYIRPSADNSSLMVRRGQDHDD